MAVIAGEQQVEAAFLGVVDDGFDLVPLPHHGAWLGTALMVVGAVLVARS